MFIVWFHPPGRDSKKDYIYKLWVMLFKHATTGGEQRLL